MKEESITYKGNDLSDKEILEYLPKDLQNLLKKINGFVAFDDGLHIRGMVDSPEWHSLQSVWVGEFALHKLFSGLKESDIPFGQDCFGDQFLLRDKTVWKLNAETDEVENLGLTLKEFLAKAEENPTEFLSLQPLIKFKIEGGIIENGQLINVYPPFCTKEAENVVSLKAVPSFERINFLADFAKQIKSI